MKSSRFCLILSALCVALTGCYKDDIQDLQSQIDSLKDNQIATISQQITSIGSTINSLQSMDGTLKSLIESLESKASDLSSSISKETSERNEAVSGLESELKTVNGLIDDLKKEDSSLEGRIDDLKTYVGSELNSVKDWASGTFATLEKQNELFKNLGSLKTTVSGLQSSLDDLDESLSGEISDLEDKLTKAISDTESDIKGWVNDQLTGYYTIAQTDAALESLESALEDKLSSQQTALETLVDSLDNALSSRLDDMDESLRDEISSVKSELEKAIAANKSLANSNHSAIVALKRSLASTKEEITEAYTSAIDSAIETAKGEITDAISKEVSTLNDRIDSEVSSINSSIDDLSSRVDALETTTESLGTKVDDLESRLGTAETEIASLLKRIQSITYIPEYSDGKASLMVGTASSTATFDFQIMPQSLADELVKAYSEDNSIVAVKAVLVKTRSGVSYIDMPVLSVKSAGDGVITVSASGENLGEAVLSGETSASAALFVSDGNTSKTSSFVNMLVSIVPETANCYIARGAGQYSFDATKVGNGSQTFVGGALYNTEIAPSSVSLLWESASGLISDLSLEDGQVSYTAADGPGNALIAALDASGTVLWSWHIWVNDAVEDVTVGGKTFLNMSLGAVSTSDLGFCYQGGRKDPFSMNEVQFASSCTSAWVAYRYKSGRYYYYQSNISYGNYPYTYSHPTVFLKSNSDNRVPTVHSMSDWYYYTGSFLSREDGWVGADFSSEDASGSDDGSSTAVPSGSGYYYATGGKTINDPCPVGYRVPSVDDFKDITLEEALEHFATNSIGARANTATLMGYVSNYVWARECAVGGSFRIFAYNSSSVEVGSSSMPSAVALPVRCVKE